MLQQNILIAKKVYQNKKRIAIATLIGALVGLVVSFFVKPVYISTAAVYPSSLPEYSEESETEQLLQFFESSEIRQFLQKKFNLYRHYGIDTTRKDYLAIYDYVYKENMKIDKTKYESVEITVKDSDPDTAKLLVNGIIDAVNYLITREHREKDKETLENEKMYFASKQHEVDSTVKLLNEYHTKYANTNMRMELTDAFKKGFKVQQGGYQNSFNDLMLLSKELKQAEKDNKSNDLAELYVDVNDYIVETGKLSVYLDDQTRATSIANNEYQKALKNYNQKTTYTVLASAPTTPVIPAWPRKGLVTLISGLAILVLSCIYVVFADRIKNTFEQIKSTTSAE